MEQHTEMNLFTIGTYYIIIFMSTMLFYMEKHFRSRGRIFEKSAIVFLLVIASLRYKSGRDYLNYYQIFDWIQNGGERFEAGFYLLYKTLGELGLSYQFSVSLISTFTLLIIVIVLIKEIPFQYRYVSLFLFLVVWENFFTIVAGSMYRQSIAVAIFILSVQYIIKKRFFAYLLMIFLGSMFHLSMVLLLPIYFISRFKLKWFYGFIALLGLFYIFPNLLPNMIKVLLNAIGLSEMANLNYLSIIHREFSIKELLKNIFYIFVFIQFIYVAKLLRKTSDEKEQIYIKLLLIGFIFKLYISVGFDMFHRILPYFYPFYIPVSYYFLREHPKIKNGYLMSLFFIFFIIVHVKQIAGPSEYADYSGGYQFVIFKDEGDIHKDLQKYNAEASEIFKKQVKRLKGE